MNNPVCTYTHAHIHMHTHAHTHTPPHTPKHTHTHLNGRHRIHIQKTDMHIMCVHTCEYIYTYMLHE